MQARALTFGLLVTLVLTACATDDLALGERYVTDRAFRRQRLEDSFVNPRNGYSTLREEEYGVEGGGWEELPQFNPPVRALTTADIGQFVSDPARPSLPSEGILSVVYSGELPRSDAEWIELGRSAFERFPVQITEVVGSASQDDTTRSRFGLWVDDRGHVGGLVRVGLADGSEGFAVTCATCHARSDDGAPLVHGATNVRFDWGALSHFRSVEAGADPDAIAYLLDWGPGQVDVTSDAQHNATAITDLRGVRHHRYLHWAGTLYNDLIALSIRIETLMITSMGRSVRPPRAVAFALAYYIWSMADHGVPGDRVAHPVGAQYFDAECGDCHGSDGTTPRARVSLESVGTDPTVGRSPERFTGYYRVPSLWQVADRRQLLHDGRVASLEELLDPMRVDTIAGHEYGLSLDAGARASLIAFVRTIGAE